MSLPQLVVTATRPVAAVSLALLAAAVLLTSQAPPASHDRYGVLFWAAASTAAALLALLLVVPRALLSRLRVGAFGGAGVLAAVVHGNGLTEGAARSLTLVVMLACLGTAIPALLVSLESAQQRPVRRL